MAAFHGYWERTSPLERRCVSAIEADCWLGWNQIEDFRSMSDIQTVVLLETARKGLKASR